MISNIASMSGHGERANSPERGTGTGHVLSQSTHDAVRSGAVAENVNGSYGADQPGRGWGAWSQRVPKMKPMMTPTAGSKQGQQSHEATGGPGHDILPPIMAPIFTVITVSSSGTCGCKSAGATDSCQRARGHGSHG